MREDNRVGLYHARCFKASGEIFFGKSRGHSLLFAALDGWLEIRLGEEKLLLGKNNLIIKSEDRTLTAVPSASCTVLAVDFTGFSEFDIFDRAIPLGRTKRRYLGEVIREMNREDEDSPELAFDGDSEDSPFGGKEIIENSLSSLLIKIVRDSVKSNSDSAEDFEVRTQVQALRRYLYENYRTKISLDSLSYLFRSNKTTICNQFRQEYGITVFAYINSLRIEEAKRLLTENIRSVTEIADHLGFESIHYFTRFFKKTTGMSPTEYKRTVGTRRRIINDE